MLQVMLAITAQTFKCESSKDNDRQSNAPVTATSAVGDFHQADMSFLLHRLANYQIMSEENMTPSCTFSNDTERKPKIAYENIHNQRIPSIRYGRPS